MRRYILVLALSASAILAGAQPIITNQPASRIVSVGGTATFSVAVSGTGPFSYQWLFNSNSIPTNGIITTVAGGGAGGGTDGLGDSGAATNASLNQPYDEAVDAFGNLFICDGGNNRVREVGTNGVITTAAGGGAGGGSDGLGDGGAATNAIFNFPSHAVVDASGNLFITDTFNNRIRKVATNGIITTFAGGGAGGGTDGLGDGGAATNASFNLPHGVALDATGNLFIADWGNNCIRKVATNGIITTFAGGGAGGGIDGLGDGGTATNAMLSGPVGVAFDASGNLFIGDTRYNRIRKVDTNGIITTFAGGGAGGGTDGLGDGGAATNAILNIPNGVTFDAFGNLFIADTSNNRVRKVNVNGIITTLAGTNSASFSGDGGAATKATLSGPQSVALDSSGNVFVADYGNNRIRKFAVDFDDSPTLTLSNVTTNNAGYYQVIVSSIYGSVTSSIAALKVPSIQITQQPTNQVVVNGGTATFGVSVSGTGPFSYQWLFNSNNITTSGIITTVAGNGSAGYSGDGGAATNASLNQTYSVSVDAAGNLFIGDSGNNRVRKVSTNGIITTVAGGGAGSGTDGIGDGAVATNASLNLPVCVSVDASGNFLIADYNNNRLRKVDANGIITTVAGGGAGGGTDGLGDGGAATNASLHHPNGVALDASGNLFIADSGNNRIRKVNTNGIITTVAGGGAGGGTDGLGDDGAATNASLNDPASLAIDNNGNLFIPDYYNNRIRKVGTNGIITTVVGNGGNSFSGDGGAATNANLNLPICVSVDASGNLFIADSGNSRVRKVDTNGIITTVAGGGAGGGTDGLGDGGAATNAVLVPASVASDASGNLFIAVFFNNRIRKIGYYSLSPTLTLNNVTANNAGYYQVIVTSPYGSVTSTVASLTLIVPPRTATATAVLAYGFLVAITNLDGGSGYTNTPLVRIIGGGGSGATAVAVVNNGVITGINVTANGSGYTNTPLMLIEPPFISNPILGIAPMTFLSFSNLTVGGNYQLQNFVVWYWSNQPVSFIATNSIYTQMVPGIVGSGNYRLALNPVPSQAFATPIVNSGFVVGATVTAGGSGYVTSPAVTVTGGGGTNAAAVSFISGGVVIGVGITDDGGGYTNTPTIRIAPPPAAAVSPTVQPVMRVDATNLAPYDNYQVQFMPDISATWQNWSNGLFIPTAVTNSQFLFITNGIGFFQLQYLGTP